MADLADDERGDALRVHAVEADTVDDGLVAAGNVAAALGGRARSRARHERRALGGALDGEAGGSGVARARHRRQVLGGVSAVWTSPSAPSPSSCMAWLFHRTNILNRPCGRGISQAVMALQVSS